MAMEIEQQQSQLIQHLVDQASTLDDPSSLATLVVQATSHPSLFAFSEILSLPSIVQLQETENSSYMDLLRLFAYGTWRDYKKNADVLPKLIPEQVLKLKQLTILTLAETNKVLFYDMLLEELEVSNVRELEDFLINECMYSGIVKGKLNQLRRCFQVQFAAGRDPIQGKLGSMIETLNNWLATSESLIPLIEEKIEWASKMCKQEEDHKKEVQEKIDKAEKKLQFKKQQSNMGHNFWHHGNVFGDVYDGMYEEEDSIRLKSRRKAPHYGQRRSRYL